MLATSLIIESQSGVWDLRGADNAHHACVVRKHTEARVAEIRAEPGRIAIEAETSPPWNRCSRRSIRKSRAARRWRVLR